MSPARILVVDDTPSNLKLLGDLLAVKGYAVTTAASGEEALSKMAAETPDLVVLDADPQLVDPHTIGAIGVVATYLEGRRFDW